MGAQLACQRGFDMADMDYGRCTWHVGDNGALTVYGDGAELVRLELTPMQLVGIARDMNKAAWVMLAKNQSKG